MKLVAAVVVVVAGCGRLGFDSTFAGGGDGGGSNSGDGGGSGSNCVIAPATMTIHAGDDFYGMLATLPAGAVVDVEAGTYTSPGFAPMTWSGTAAQPIIVRAAGATRPKLVNTPGNNGLDLYGQYFTLEGFEFTGGDEGVRLGGVNHVTLEDLYIHDVVDQGVTCNRPSMSCDTLTLRRIEVANTSNASTGHGFTLGCNDNSCGVTNSVVEGCYVHDTMAGGSGVSVWKHSALIIRDNVFVRTDGSGIVLQESGTGGIATIERNLVWNPNNNGIQVEGQVIVRNNLVLGANPDGIASRTESGSAPINVTIVHNTVDGATGACVHGLDWSGTTQTVANNAYACAGGAEVLSGTPVVGGAIVLGANDVGTVPNVYPTATSAVIDAGDPAHGAADDFNGTPRTGIPDSGAYERTAASNPGWTPSAMMKPLLAPACP